MLDLPEAVVESLSTGYYTSCRLGPVCLVNQSLPYSERNPWIFQKSCIWGEKIVFSDPSLEERNLISSCNIKIYVFWPKIKSKPKLGTERTTQL